MSSGPAPTGARVVIVVNDDPLMRAREEAFALAHWLADPLGLVVVGSIS